MSVMIRDYRQMEPAERRAIEQKIRKQFFKPFAEVRKPSDAAGLLFAVAGFAVLGVLVGTVALTLVYLVSRILPGVPLMADMTRPAVVRTIMVVSGALGALGIPAWLWSRYRKTRTDRDERLKADLTDGRVEVLRVEATQAARCPSMEYSGKAPKAFFLQVGKSEAMFLQGSYLSGALRSKKFPNSDFEIIRGTQSGEALGIRCLGSPLPLEKHDYAGITDEEFYFPRDGEIVSARLETLPESLRKLKRPI